MSAKDIASGNEILRGIVGSTAHGLAIDGQDDRDEMGVFIEPAEFVCGLTPMDHWIYRDKPEGVRSEAGDLDLTMYSLRKFCRLAEQGNPSVMVLLWLSEHLVCAPAGKRLINLREAFISRESGERFLGYLVAQRMKMTGERTQTVKRTELIEKYGFDTKFAMHALRLGFEGIELMTHRRLTLPIAEPNLSILRGVRTGAYSIEDTLQMINKTENDLREILKDCDWKTDKMRINAAMVRAHLDHWILPASKRVLDRIFPRISSMEERSAVDGETQVRSLHPGPL